jgi:protein TonB
MERPSHITFHTSHMSRRLPLFALAAFLQVGAVTLIMTGLGHFIPIKPGGLVFIPQPDQPTIDKMPPPLPTEIKPTLPHADDPIFKTDPDPGSTGIRVSTGPVPDLPPKPQPPVPDRAAIGIAATHTTPPYPAIAIRQGAEGKVVLKLSVLETGRVAKADIVTSSGSEALDQAAQAWIVGHWTYRPATAAGQPVASQALASVSFNLKDAR